MNILLIYGGTSCEHDVSVITACLARGYFQGNLYCAYLSKSNECFLVPNDYTPARHVTEKLKNRVVFLFGEGKFAVMRGKRIVKTVQIDAVVNCCHGYSGEDGSVAALCQLLNVPLIGSPLIPSAVAMDKYVSKIVLREYGFPVLEGFELKRSDDLKDCTVNYPVVVKPVTLGSSIGVAVARDDDELATALLNAFKYDGRVLVERALGDFTELNCAVMRTRGEVVSSAVDCPVTLNDILTFEDKYVSGSAADAERAKVPDSLVAEVKKMTERIYERLGFSGVIRVDYLLDNERKELYVNEINAIPGSLAYGLWEQRFTRAEYGQALVEQAVADHRENACVTRVFESTVLSGANGVKKK